MVTQIKISELPLASEDALSLAADDRFIFNNDNVNTQTIKFANLVDAILEQNLTFSGNCSFLQPITGPNGGDIQVGLDDLTDVQFQNVTSGQIITYSGTQWINRDVKDIALQLDSLSVVISDTPSGGGSLVYDNATGVFTFTPAITGTFNSASISVQTNSAASGGGGLVYNPANSVFTFTPADCYTKAETYNQIEIDDKIALRAAADDVYTKTEVDAALAAKANNLLLGVANGSTNLGDFSGTTINPNQDVKTCLQDLETALEAIDGTDVSLTDFTVSTSTASGGGTLAYNNAGVFTFAPADLAPYATSTSVTTEIANVVGANLDLSSKNTGDLVEGTNLYYTDARADARVANAASNFTSAAEGTANSNAIDNLIACSEVAIGAADGDITATNAALAALTRDNT